MVLGVYRRASRCYTVGFPITSKSTSIQGTPKNLSGYPSNVGNAPVTCRFLDTRALTPRPYSPPFRNSSTILTASSKLALDATLFTTVNSNLPTHPTNPSVIVKGGALSHPHFLNLYEPLSQSSQSNTTLTNLESSTLENMESCAPVENVSLVQNTKIIPHKTPSVNSNTSIPTTVGSEVARSPLLSPTTERRHSIASSHGDTQQPSEDTSSQDNDNSGLSTRKNHAYKRAEEPPRNHKNKMICKHSECANVAFDRKCEWKLVYCLLHMHVANISSVSIWTNTIVPTSVSSPAVRSSKVSPTTVDYYATSVRFTRCTAALRSLSSVPLQTVDAALARVSLARRTLLSIFAAFIEEQTYLPTQDIGPSLALTPRKRQQKCASLSSLRIDAPWTLTMRA
jgi:hypothetical protein